MRCQTSHETELASSEGRALRTSGDRPSTAAWTSSWMRLYASMRMSFACMRPPSRIAVAHASGIQLPWKPSGTRPGRWIGRPACREVLGGQDYQVGGPAIGIVHIGDRVAVVLGPCALGGDEDGFPAAASRGSRWTCVVAEQVVLDQRVGEGPVGGFPSGVRYARVMSAAAAWCR